MTINSLNCPIGSQPIHFIAVLFQISKGYIVRTLGKNKIPGFIKIQHVYICWISHVEPNYLSCRRGRHGRDRMVVGFTTTCASSTYHH